ncbi:MAG: hypothetical protein KOO69_06730 [Victivallales bacterium]|nr:hypothetical protein [Victivallales bacterium]
MKKNTILTILDFNGIPDKYEKKLYDAMEYLGNKERLVICLYFMSELSVKSMTHYNIERNLRRIFPPSKKGKLPDDYKDFQASVQRSYFDRETQKIKEKEINLEDRLWKNLGDGLWKNTEKGNCLAVATLKKEGYDIHKEGAIYI